MTRVQPLRRLLDSRRPLTYGIVQAGEHVSDGVPYIRPVDMTGASGVPDEELLLRTSPEIASQYKRSRIAAGDLVVSIGPSYGKVMVVPPTLGGANLTQGTARCAPGAQLDVRWLYWFLQSVLAREFWDTEVSGATFSALNLGPLGRTPTPVLHLDEQRRIADFLDDQVARIDNIVAAREKQRTLIDENFEAIREREVHNGDFSQRQLGQLTFPQRPINYGVLMPGPRLDSGIPLVEAGDAMRGPIVFADLRRTDPSIEIEYSRSRLQSGDLVMAIRGSVGAVQRMPELAGSLANVTRDAARISVNDTVADPGWVRHSILTHRLQEWLRVRTGGSAVTGINIGDLRKLPIPLPSAAQQRRSSSLLDAWELEFRSALQILWDSIESLGQLKRSLITAAVTGEFDVSTANGSRVPV